MPRALDWPSLPGDANRVAMRARIEVGEMEGFLAYDGDEVVGWMNAQPRHKLPHCFERMRIAAPATDVRALEAAVIVCFVIAPRDGDEPASRARCSTAAWRSLPRAASSSSTPFRSSRARATSAADHYHGSLSMFLQAGFA